FESMDSRRSVGATNGTPRREAGSRKAPNERRDGSPPVELAATRSACRFDRRAHAAPLLESGRRNLLHNLCNLLIRQLLRFLLVRIRQLLHFVLARVAVVFGHGLVLLFGLEVLVAIPPDVADRHLGVLGKLLDASRH